MDIRLSVITIRDFKGTANQGIEFQGKSASILADNAVGKTTIYDAFLWCLFGKDSKGKSDFEVVPLTDGQPNRMLEPTVELSLLIDDEPLLLKRQLAPKWLNRRGAVEKTFDGYTTNYWVNEVPVQQKDYKAKIDSIVSETTFRIVTNVDAFLTMNKKDQRSYLLNMIDGIDPLSVCNGDRDLIQVVSTMKAKNYSTEDILKIVTGKIKEYKKEQDQIPARIDEIKRVETSQEDADKLKLQIGALEKEIEAGQPGRYESIKANYDMLEKGCNDIKAHMEDLKKEYAVNEDIIKGNGVEVRCDKCHQVISDTKEFGLRRKAELLKLGTDLKATYQGLNTARESALKELELCRKPESVAEQKKFLGELQTKLIQAEQSHNAKVRVEELTNRNRELATLIVSQEGIKNSVERFIRAKAEAVESAVNDLFPTLKFRLFEEALNGNVSDDCTALINGNVPYTDCSRSEAIRAGQEVINAIQRHHSISAPVFIDNAESATFTRAMDCQTIKMYVVAGQKELKVEVE